MRRRYAQTELLGMGNCPACKRDDHQHCTNRATDNVTGLPTNCYCRDIGHHANKTWRESIR